MKKFLLVTLALVLCFSMYACESTNPTKDVVNKVHKTTTDYQNKTSAESKDNDTNKEKLISLDTLTPISSDFTWNSGLPTDIFGNDYSNIKNYTILHASDSAISSCYHPKDYSAEYNTNRNYDYLQLTISPHSDFNENGKAYIQIYVNDILRYTTEQINQKTQPITSLKIDISDADYIKIFSHIDGNSCLILTDVMLISSPNHIDQQADNTTSLSKLNFFNGSLPWYNDFPADIMDSDYSTVQNYAVLHSDSNTLYSCIHPQTHSVEFYTQNNYKSLSFDIAPYTDFGENGSSIIKIYADDNLIYTSPTIMQKTLKFSTETIDISEANYIKIVAELQGYSCIIISNAILENI